MRTAARAARAPGITARSDRATVTFGEALPEDEQQYLAAVVLRALAGG